MTKIIITFADMRTVQVTDIADTALDIYARLTEADLRRAPEGGLFVAESPKVIKVALESGWEPVSMLCEPRHVSGDAAQLLDMIADTPAADSFTLFTGERDLLRQLTGYTLTRGVLCAMRRRQLPDVAEICSGAQRLAVLDNVCDTTNIGAIFRSAAALGIDGVLLTPGTCDPLNRRAVRVSMGTVFRVPWTWLDAPVSSLADYGFKTVALALTDRSVSIDNPTLMAEPRLALLLGTEGDGLAQETITACDYTARIPMSLGVDSLNVAAASAVAFWQLRARK